MDTATWGWVGGVQLYAHKKILFNSIYVGCIFSFPNFFLIFLKNKYFVIARLCIFRKKFEILFKTKKCHYQPHSTHKDI